MISYSIKDFFSKKFETESTKLLLDTPSYFSAGAMEDYVYKVCRHPLDDFIQYRFKNPINAEITSKDITQLSSIEDCTINMCKMMLLGENRGYSLSEIATELHMDNTYKNNYVALTKYGENQVKTASQLGLCFYKDELWYLTSLGVVFPKFQETIQNKIISICLLRDPFYSKVICSICQKDTCLLDFMGILSESTKKRRASSCSKVLSFFIKQCQEEDVCVYNIITKK